MRAFLICLYGFLCVVGLVIALTPSVILNVWPYYTHDKLGMAAVQFILALGAAATPLAMSELPVGWRWATGCLLAALLWVCIGNGIESSTLMRVDLTASRNDKAFTVSDWDTQIEKWTTDADRLKAALKKNDQDVRVGEDSLNAAKERESLACKAPTSTACRDAQVDLRQTTRDYDLTKRVDRLEEQIESAKAERRTLGAAPPDHLKNAAEEAEWLLLNPLSHRPTAIAFAGEGWAALGMKIMMALISALFVKAFGPMWWEKNESPLESSPATQLNPQPIISSPSAMATPAGPKRVLYAPGVEAWGNQVRLQPGQRGMVLSPSQALPYYQAFCESKGYPTCKLGLFGSILRQECGFKLVKKVGGVGYYEFNVKPPSASKVIALVRETA